MLVLVEHESDPRNTDIYKREISSNPDRFICPNTFIEKLCGINETRAASSKTFIAYTGLADVAAVCSLLASGSFFKKHLP